MSSFFNMKEYYRVLFCFVIFETDDSINEANEYIVMNECLILYNTKRKDSMNAATTF